MTNELPVWQLILLAVVYLTDLVLIARLCRDEVRDWGNERIGRHVSVEWVKHRIGEIEAAGLAVVRRPIHGIPSIRLSALGVERLSGVDHPVERANE